ncbi:hypothetical protein SDC9_141086 [bioreactor metagenome]|uniref:Uncharacterized protein n=1 Tax=bioreactor metagenome TaxID=1076179 RepID=A0A645DWN8_9ZZZZ
MFRNAVVARNAKTHGRRHWLAGGFRNRNIVGVAPDIPHHRLKHARIGRFRIIPLVKSAIVIHRNEVRFDDHGAVVLQQPGKMNGLIELIQRVVHRLPNADDLRDFIVGIGSKRLWQHDKIG